MATIRDVARESGVSVATVSYVLNDGPRRVSDARRRQVLAAVERLGYTPNVLARALSSRRVHTLGVLFGRVEPAIVTNQYVTAVLQGVMAVASESGYNVSFFTQPWKDAAASAGAFKDGRCDGVLVIAPLSSTDMVEGLARLQIPLVVVSAAAPEGSGIPSTDVDNAAGARLAADHLLSLGHTRIAHLMGEEEQPYVPARRAGFLNRLNEAGLAVPPPYLARREFEPDQGYSAACRLLSLPEPPTALFAGNDRLALGALRAAQDLGIPVPEALSIIGFDDIPAAAMVTPSLTTVRQPLTRIGERATRLLVARIEGDATAQVQYRARPELVVRASTAPPTPCLPGRREVPFISYPQPERGASENGAKHET